MASSRSGCLRPFLVAVILFTSISIAILYVVYNSGQYLYEEDETSAYLIEGALVFDGENWLPGTPKVLIVDGKIQCMGPDCQLPVGSKTINAAGMTLLPGLTDLQVQFYRPTKEYEGLSNPERLLRFTKQRPEVRQNFHKAGVTQVRSCGDALKNIMALREQMEDLQFSGPDIYIVGPMITAVGGHPAVTEYAGNEYLIQEACRQVKDVEDMKQIIQELADNRVNTIKMVFTSFGGKVARLSNEALIAGIEMATSKGLLVSVLTGTEEEMVTAAEAGATLIEYGTRFPISAETAKLLRDRGVVWVPVLMRAKDDAALLADLQRTMFLADSMGVLIGSGAEAGESVYMGESLLDELGLLHDAGISTVHILQAATSVAARALGMEDSWGYVRPGYRANLILVEGNIQVEFSALSRLRYLWQIGHLTIGEGLLVDNGLNADD